MSAPPEGPRVRVRRVYEQPAPDDGTRVLVDRLWPRGMGKDRAAADEWCKQVAPSTGLRTWYQHDPGRYEEFRRRYVAELAEPEPAAALAHLRDLAAERPLTLLTSVRDTALSHASVLVELLGGDPAGGG